MTCTLGEHDPGSTQDRRTSSEMKRPGWTLKIFQCGSMISWSPNANAESCWWSLISLIYRKLTFPHGQRPSSAHHPQEADSASELQRYFASGANHSLRTPGNHVNCQISILGNSSENSTWVFLLSTFPLASGWWVDDRQVEANCGYSRAVHCRWKPRLRESPPLLRSPVLPFDCLPETTDKQQNSMGGRPIKKVPFLSFLTLAKCRF